jgi:hypothetical protein
MDRMVDLYHSGLLARLDKWQDAAPACEYRSARILFRQGWVELKLVLNDGIDTSVGYGSDLDGDRAMDLALDAIGADLRVKAERRLLDSASSTERHPADSERDARDARGAA